MCDDKSIKHHYFKQDCLPIASSQGKDYTTSQHVYRSNPILLSIILRTVYFIKDGGKSVLKQCPRERKQKEKKKKGCISVYHICMCIYVHFV